MNPITAKSQGIALCSACQQLNQLGEIGRQQQAFCVRCHAPIAFRKPHSVAWTWAFTLSGVVMFFPANLLPIMTVLSFGHRQQDTILSGVVHLIQAGMVPIALVVLVASILVPLFKLIGLIFLLLVIQYRWQLSYRQCTWLFHMIHFIGRWSMLDLFIIAILVNLVDFGAVATIEAGMGATAFAAVVVLTMLAAQMFDTRLIWDLQESKQ